MLSRDLEPEQRLSRRRFLRFSVAGVAGATLASLLSACGGGGAAPTAAPAKPAEGAKPGEAAKPAAQAGPGGFSGGGALKLLMRAHFVPAYDAFLDKWAADWGEKNKVEVTVDHILSGELASKLAAEVAAGSGHDIYALTRAGEMPLYNKQLTDVSDLATQIGQAHGGWVPLGEQIGKFEGVWKAVPEFFIDFPALYRKDIFDANGLQPVDTWDDLLKVGTLLKEKGNPIGIAINQKSNDASNDWNALLWCYGASTVAQDGKTVTLNSPETKEALKYAIDLYKNTMTDEVLSWDDSGNNQMLASGRASWIHNPISAYLTIVKDNPELAKNIYVSNTPAGPKGRHAPVSVNSFGVMNWANVPAAKAFITDYYEVFMDGFKASGGYNQPLLKDFRKKPMPILGEEPKYQLLQDFDQYAHAVGWPGPPTPAAGEVENNWIVPLMVGRAVQDGNVDDAASWGQQKVEAIYAKYK
jgi:multiple sugar transport system substrate-binding protein